MKPLLLILSFFLLTLTVQSQKVITVDNRANSGADYTSLSEAVTNAFVGDTIQIHPSATAYGNTGNVNKRLHFVGLGHNPALSKYGEKAIVGGITFNGNCANSSVTGLQFSTITVSGPIDISGIRIINNRIISYVRASNSAAIQNWLIEGNLFDSAYVQPYADGWTVKNNIFDNGTYAIYNTNNTFSFLNNLVILANGNFASACTDPIVNNNIFILEGSTTDVVLNNSTIVFNNNLTQNTTGFTVTALNGSSNLDNTSPGFAFTYANIADYYNNDYNVSGAAELAGTDGTDLGVFGANFNFDVDGRPDDYPYMTSLDISNSSVPLGQNINVTFTAGKKQ